jgi:peroxiredoxin
MNQRCIRPAITIVAVAFAALSFQGWVRASVEIDKPAPGFTLEDSHGRPHSLSDYAGKIVVLEWLNHSCPFVRKHYGTNNMQSLQKTYTERGVVWLSINSSAPGKQGHCTPEKANELSAEHGAAPTAVLLDTDGIVGRLYGARTTPHMFVIDREGSLVYNGAIDDRPSVDPSDVEGATNYVAAALVAVLAGESPEVKTSKPYGCSVKY